MARSRADGNGATTKIGFPAKIYNSCVFLKILGMALPGVGGVGAPRGSIFCIWTGPHLPYTAKSEKSRTDTETNIFILKINISPIEAVWGLTLGSFARPCW